MPELDPAVRTYYERGDEADRLVGGFPAGPLELARTQELIVRHLAGSPLDVLDVGGGPGRYAAWLHGLGHRVHLVDPVELHLRQAGAIAPGVTVELGDARALTQADASVDVVLLLGPLYHLPERTDRLRALGEARRVLRPGGVLFAAAISRYAALFDTLVRLDRLHDPDVRATVEAGLRAGAFEGDRGGLFTHAYFHHPDELGDELAEAGFTGTEVFNIEGPGFLVADIAERWADPARREVLLAAARLVEQEPSLMGASSHLMAVATRV